MKGKILLLIFVVSSVLVGCSDTDSCKVLSERPSDTPILLNSNLSFNANVTTRASIDTILELDRVGIFCAARQKTNINGSLEAPEPDWSVLLDTSSVRYGYTTNGLYWPNIACEVLHDSSSAARLKVEEGQAYIWYYPITSWYGYDFYGYHPYQNSFRSTTDSITVDFEIDGTQDILWGRSEKKSENFAYSARYFRSSKDSVAHMRFKHCLTQFQFYIVSAKSPDKADPNLTSFNDIKGMSVKEIRMLDIYKNLRMTVANRLDESMVGRVYPNGYEIADFVLKDTFGIEVAQNPVPFKTQIVDDEEIADTVRVGECVMVCSNQPRYYMSMVLCDSNNPDLEYHSEKRMTIRLSDDSEFQPGHIYKIYIKASGVTNISLDATLDNWIEAPDDDNLDFEID